MSERLVIARIQMAQAPREHLKSFRAEPHGRPVDLELDAFRGGQPDAVGRTDQVEDLLRDDLDAVLLRLNLDLSSAGNQPQALFHEQRKRFAHARIERATGCDCHMPDAGEGDMLVGRHMHTARGRDGGAFGAGQHHVGTGELWKRTCTLRAVVMAVPSALANTMSARASSGNGCSGVAAPPRIASFCVSIARATSLWSACFRCAPCCCASSVRLSCTSRACVSRAIVSSMSLTGAAAPLRASHAHCARS
nr:hypothetical protein [Burkholderia ubonensis]